MMQHAPALEFALSGICQSLLLYLRAKLNNTLHNN